MWQIHPKGGFPISIESVAGTREILWLPGSWQVVYFCTWHVKSTLKGAVLVCQSMFESPVHNRGRTCIFWACRRAATYYCPWQTFILLHFWTFSKSSMLGAQMYSHTAFKDVSLKFQTGFSKFCNIVSRYIHGSYVRRIAIPKELEHINHQTDLSCGQST